MKKRSLNSVLHCRVTREDLSQLEEIAAENDLSASQVVRRALRETFQKKDSFDRSVSNSKNGGGGGGDERTGK